MRPQFFLTPSNVGSEVSYSFLCDKGMFEGLKTTKLHLQGEGESSSKVLVCYSKEQQVAAMEWHNDISTVIVTSPAHQKTLKRSRSVYTCTYT